jgi:hypothetical protein
MDWDSEVFLDAIRFSGTKRSGARSAGPGETAKGDVKGTRSYEYASAAMRGERS